MKPSITKWVVPFYIFSLAAPVLAEDQNDPAPVNEAVAKTTDSDLETRIKSELDKDTTLSDEAKKVDVTAKDGRVTLEGSVKTLNEKRKIESIATRAAGKKRVTNKLKISS